MAQITIYHDSDVTVNVVEGIPPADQSALIAQLQADLAVMTAERDALQSQVITLQGKIDAAKAAAQADKDADNANVAGQGVLDALA